MLFGGADCPTRFIAGIATCVLPTELEVFDRMAAFEQSQLNSWEFGNLLQYGSV